MKKIRIAVVGVGNCFSSLLQGINFYGDTSRNGSSDVGLMHRRIGPYEPQDIEVVAASVHHRVNLARRLCLL